MKDKVKTVIIGILACLIVTLFAIVMIKWNGGSRNQDVDYSGFERTTDTDEGASDETDGEAINVDKLPLIPVEPVS